MANKIGYSTDTGTVCQTKEMKMYRDFDAETDPQAHNDPPTFRLGGVEFVCAPEIPGGVILDMGSGGAKSVAGITEMFRAALGEGYETFEKMIHDRDNVISMKQVTAIGEWLSAEYTKRPTGGSSSATSGSQSSGGGSTEAPSLAVVTYARSQPHDS